MSATGSTRRRARKRTNCAFSSRWRKRSRWRVSTRRGSRSYPITLTTNTGIRCGSRLPSALRAHGYHCPRARGRGKQIRPSVRQIRRTRQDPIQPGISIAHKDVSAGTLGAIVYDRRTGQPYVLSNWHVLQGGTGEIGDRVIHPAPTTGDPDGRTSQEDLCAVTLAWPATVRSLPSRTAALTERIVGLDVIPERRIGKVELRDRVAKSGPTTGVTRGIVTRTGVTSNISYRGVGVREIGGFEIRPDPEHLPSDGESRVAAIQAVSGSWLRVSTRMWLSGCISRGSQIPAPEAENALACNIHSVFEKLDVSFNRIPTSESDCALLRRSVDVASGLPVETPEDEDDEPDLSLENVAEIQQRLFREPRETLEFFRRAVDQNLDRGSAR